MPKHIRDVERLFKKSPVVSFSDVDRRIKSKKDTAYAKQLIRALLEKGRIKRLTKGYYTKFDEVGLSVLCFKPAYLGLQSALSFHRLWEQEAIPVIITSNSVRPGRRKCMGTSILIRRSAKKYVFGYAYLDDSGFYLPYSDLEKTFIDFYVFREKLSTDVIKKFKNRISVSKLKKYLTKYPKNIRIKVWNALFR